MKKFTKLLGIVLIIALVMSMGAMALAEGGETPAGGTTAITGPQKEHTITITAKATQNEKHTYEAYQIFVGTYDSTSNQLQNFTWGSNVTSATLLAALAGDATIGSGFNTSMTAA